MQTPEQMVEASRAAAEQARARNKTLTERVYRDCPEHRVESTDDQPFDRCVVVHVLTPCNPASHGNVTRIERCRCGARKAVNVNGLHTEESPWVALTEEVPHVLSLEEARAKIAALDDYEQRSREARIKSHKSWLLTGLRTPEGAMFSWRRIKLTQVAHHEVRVTLDGATEVLSWAQLRAAAEQPDEGLTALYSAILQVATERLAAEAL